MLRELGVVRTESQTRPDRSARCALTPRLRRLDSNAERRTELNFLSAQSNATQIDLQQMLHHRILEGRCSFRRAILTAKRRQFLALVADAGLGARVELLAFRWRSMNASVFRIAIDRSTASFEAFVKTSNMYIQNLLETASRLKENELTR